MDGLIRQKWLALSARFPAHEAMTEKQLQDVERIYYAGASAFFQILLAIPDPSADAITALVTELHTEVVEYVKVMQSQMAKEAAAIDE